MLDDYILVFFLKKKGRTSIFAFPLIENNFHPPFLTPALRGSGEKCDFLLYDKYEANTANTQIHVTREKLTVRANLLLHHHLLALRRRVIVTSGVGCVVEGWMCLSNFFLLLFLEGEERFMLFYPVESFRFPCIDRTHSLPHFSLPSSKL
jgi:hypothetical protein